MKFFEVLGVLTLLATSICNAIPLWKRAIVERSADDNGGFDCDHVMTGNFTKNLRSTCPWYYETQRDENRYPEILTVAKLHCPNQGCLGDTTGKLECVSITQPVNIEVKIGTSLQGDVYVTQEVQLPVGFTCAGRKSGTQETEKSVNVVTTTTTPTTKATTTKDIFNK